MMRFRMQPQLQMMKIILMKQEMMMINRAEATGEDEGDRRPKTK